jgi:hypothetical protein
MDPAQDGGAERVAAVRDHDVRVPSADAPAEVPRRPESPQPTGGFDAGPDLDRRDAVRPRTIVAVQQVHARFEPIVESGCQMLRGDLGSP